MFIVEGAAALNVGGVGTGAGAGLSVMKSSGSKGSMGGREGRALEMRDRPVVGSAREDDGSNMVGAQLRDSARY